MSRPVVPGNETAQSSGGAETGVPLTGPEAPLAMPMQDLSPGPGLTQRSVTLFWWSVDAIAFRLNLGVKTGR